MAEVFTYVYIFTSLDFSKDFDNLKLKTYLLIKSLSILFCLCVVAELKHRRTFSPWTVAPEWVNLICRFWIENKSNVYLGVHSMENVLHSLVYLINFFNSCNILVNRFDWLHVKYVTCFKFKYSAFNQRSLPSNKFSLRVQLQQKMEK